MKPSGGGSSSSPTYEPVIPDSKSGPPSLASSLEFSSAPAPPSTNNGSLKRSPSCTPTNLSPRGTPPGASLPQFPLAGKISAFSIDPNLKRYKPPPDVLLGQATDIKVLVAGTKAVALVASNFLRQFHFEVSSAESGADARSMLRSTPVLRVLLCHVSLNDMSGLDLVSQCKELRSDVPAVLILNSQMDHEIAEKAVGAGALDCLPSPITIETIKSRVTCYIENIWLHEAVSRMVQHYQTCSESHLQLLTQYNWNLKVFAAIEDRKLSREKRRVELQDGKQDLETQITTSETDMCQLQTRIHDLQIQLSSLCYQVNLLEDEKQSCEYLNTQLSIKQQEIERLEKGLKKPAAPPVDVLSSPIQIILQAIQELQALEDDKEPPSPAIAKPEENPDKNSRFKGAVQKIIAGLSEASSGEDLLSLSAKRLQKDCGLDSMTKNYLCSYLRNPHTPAKAMRTVSNEREQALEGIKGQVILALKNRHKKIDHSDADAFNWHPWEHGSKDLCSYVVYFFEELGLIQQFRIPLDTMFHFVLSIQYGYKEENPYHNWFHAVDVLQVLNAVKQFTHLSQTVYLVLRTTRARELLSAIDAFALMVSALCHDFEHPGVNNTYQVRTQSRWSLVYNDYAVLENMHCSHTFRVLLKPKNNILAALDNEEQKDFRQTVISNILATDMSQHFELVTKFTTHLQTRPFTSSSEDRQLVSAIILHFADVSNFCRPLEISRYWADQMQEEFLRQGDLENKSGMEISPFMNRAEINQPKMALGFIDFMIHPLVNVLLRLLPELSYCLQNLKENRKHWTDLIGKPNVFGSLSYQDLRRALTGKLVKVKPLKGTESLQDLKKAADVAAIDPLASLNIPNMQVKSKYLVSGMKASDAAHIKSRTEWTAHKTATIEIGSSVVLGQPEPAKPRAAPVTKLHKKGGSRPSTTFPDINNREVTTGVVNYSKKQQTVPSLPGLF